AFGRRRARRRPARRAARATDRAGLRAAAQRQRARAPRPMATGPRVACDRRRRPSHRRAPAHRRLRSGARAPDARLARCPGARPARALLASRRPMTPDEYCRERTTRSGSSFSYSFLFLPADRRRAITALYAFCREVDDVVDESTDAGLARTRLDWWRAEIDRLYEGRPQHPVTRALAPHLGAYALERARLLEIVDGMQMDLEQ